MNGRASAPPAIGCIIGVSTSRKPAAVEETPDAGHHARPSLEHPPRIGIDDEIEVALAVPRFDVGQAMPLLRQRQQAFREEVQPRGPDRQLVGLRPEEPPFDADVIAKVEQLDRCWKSCCGSESSRIYTCSRESVGEDEEVGLAEPPNAEDPAGDADGGRSASSASPRLVAVRGDDRRDRGGAIEPVRVRGARPARTSSSSLACRCAICSASLDMVD